MGFETLLKWVDIHVHLEDFQIPIRVDQNPLIRKSSGFVYHHQTTGWLTRSMAE